MGNSKQSHFDTIGQFIDAVRGKPFAYRLKIKDQPVSVDWSKWLTQPSDSYIEAEAQGPYSIRDIERIEIDPVEKKAEGKLIKVKALDHSEMVIKLPEDLKFSYSVTDHIISVNPARTRS